MKKIKSNGLSGAQSPQNAQKSIGRYMYLTLFYFIYTFKMTLFYQMNSLSAFQILISMIDWKISENRFKHALSLRHLRCVLKEELYILYLKVFLSNLFKRKRKILRNLIERGRESERARILQFLIYILVNFRRDLTLNKLRGRLSWGAEARWAGAHRGPSPRRLSVQPKWS